MDKKYITLDRTDPLYNTLNCFDFLVFRFIEEWCKEHQYFDMPANYLREKLPGKKVCRITVIRSLKYLVSENLLEKYKPSKDVSFYKPNPNARGVIISKENKISSKL